MLNEVLRTAAAHDAAAGFNQLAERWPDTERQLLEESTRRIHDFELRLQHEWEALRQLHEEPIRELEARGAALSKSYADATRAAHDSIHHAESRLDAFEQRISSQMAEAAREFREAVAGLRDSMNQPAGRRMDVAVGGAVEALTLTGLPRRAQKLIAALLCGLVALIIFSLYLYSRLGEASERTAAVEQEAQNVRQLAETNAKSTTDALETAMSDALSAAARAERIANVLAAADLQRFELQGERGAPAASGQALWSPSRGLVLAASRMPPVPAGQIGQAWLVTTRGSISLGLASPDGQGRLSAAFDPPAPLAGTVTGFMVTLERAGGSAKPTGPLLLAS